MEMKLKPECPLVARGQIKLRIQVCQELITVFVYEACHLNHSKLKDELCSIYVKMSVIPDVGDCDASETKLSTNTTCPKFNEALTYEILPGDSKKRIWITVWCKDSHSGQDELIGCLSFGMKHLAAKTKKQPVDGWFYILSESIGRRKHVQIPIIHGNANTCKDSSRSENDPGILLPPLNLQLQSLTSISIILNKKPSGFGFTLKGACPVYVGRVYHQSSASEAGLVMGDFIERVNGQNVSRSTAESVAEIIRSTEQILVLHIYRQYHHRKRPLRTNHLFEHDENDPLHVMHSLNPSGLPVAEDDTIDLFHKSTNAKFSPKSSMWSNCHRSREVNSAYSLDSSDQQKVTKRQKLDLVNMHHAKNNNSLFQLQSNVLNEVFADEHNLEKTESSPIKMNHSSQIPTASVLLSRNPGVCSTAEFDNAFVLYQDPSELPMIWDPYISVINKSFSVLHRFVGDSSLNRMESDVYFNTSLANGCNEEISDSNGKLFDKAFLSITSNYESSGCLKINSHQTLIHSSLMSSKVCDSLVHSFLMCEEKFFDYISNGVQRFSRPLRHCIISRCQHSALFQNIEKLMVLSEFNIRNLTELCSCDSSPTKPQTPSVRKSASTCAGTIVMLYMSKLKLMIQAYRQYLEGMTVSWQVLDQLSTCPQFINFTQTSNSETDLTLESFIRQPKQHVDELVHELQLFVRNSSQLTEDESTQLNTVFSSLNELAAMFGSSPSRRLSLRLIDTPAEQVTEKNSTTSDTVTENQEIMPADEQLGPALMKIR